MKSFIEIRIIFRLWLLLALSVFYTSACVDGDNSPSDTEVRIRIARAVDTGSGVTSRPIINPGPGGNPIVAVRVIVLAPDFPRPLEFVFTPAEVAQNNGIVVMPVPTGLERTFFVEAIDIYQTPSPNQFPGKIYLPNTPAARSEEHTSELQSHSFISYAVFCLKKKKNN